MPSLNSLPLLLVLRRIMQPKAQALRGGHRQLWHSRLGCWECPPIRNHPPAAFWQLPILILEKVLALKVLPNIEMTGLVDHGLGLLADNDLEPGLLLIVALVLDSFARFRTLAGILHLGVEFFEFGVDQFN